MMDVMNAEEAIHANLGLGLSGTCDGGLGLDNLTFDINSLAEYINDNDINLGSLADEPLPPPTSFAAGCNMEAASVKESLAQRLHVPPGGPPPPAHMYSTAPGQPPISQHGQQPMGQHGQQPLNHNGQQPLNHNGQQSISQHGQQAIGQHGQQTIGQHGQQQLVNQQGQQGISQHGQQPINQHGQQPISQHGQQKNSHFSHTHFPESPPDSGSEPYSPPNENHTNDVKGNIGMNGLPQHLPYMGGNHTPAHKNLPQHNSNMSPPHTQNSPNSHPHPPLHTGPQTPAHLHPSNNGPLHNNHPKAYPGYICQEPPKLNHPGPSTTPMSMLGHPAATSVAPVAMLNPAHLMPNGQYPNMNNITNHPPKKRKYSDSPNSTLTPGLLNGMGLGGIPNGIKTEPTDNHSSYGVLGPEVIDDDTYSQYDLQSDGAMFMDGSYQVIKWQAFQPTKWNTLCDEGGKDLPAPIYRVDADKGFNYATPDDAFVCQKKNHFQVTIHIGLNGNAKKIKLQDGTQSNIDSFHIHFWGVKKESQTQSIKVEQSQSDRSKKAFHPVKVDLTSDQVTKVTVGRLHFSETTSNNMRKKGKPNPDQRYFMLVVGLHAHCGEESHLLAAHCSERIIVRASNPGQFENDVDVPWSKGRTSDAVVHAGRVGINTDSPDEALTVHGNVKVTGHVMQPSDRRAKTDISELDTRKQLENISKMRVYHYAYQEDFAEYAGLSEEECHDTGVLAQDVSQVLPDAVRETGDIILPSGDRIDNFLCVNKDRIYMENVGAVKELCKVTDKLENRIAEIEAMKKKLIKQRDSLRSTSSSCKSACSTISRTSSIPPLSAKDKEKKGSNSSHHRSCHHRHHHHHRGSGPPEQEGVCNNRVIQITVIVLVLVMAFCLVAITTLYILDRQPPIHLDQSNGSATPVLFDDGNSNNNSSNSTSSSSSISPPTAGTAHAPPRAPPLEPPRCRRNKNCSIVCCVEPRSLPTQTPLNDPGRGRHMQPTPQGGKPAPRGPNEVLPPDKGPDYIIVTEQPPLTKARFVPQMVDVRPLPGDPHSMNDQPMDDYPYYLPQQSDADGRPKILVNDNNVIKSRRKRSTPANSDLTATLVITQINQTLDSYCVDDNCTQLIGGNYTYSVPISRFFPEAFVTINFLFERKAHNLSVSLCDEFEDTACSEPRYEEATDIKATPSTGHAWDLPVGYYHQSLFVFRVAENDMANLCSAPSSGLDKNFTEYHLHFYRYCNDTE